MTELHRITTKLHRTMTQLPKIMTEAVCILALAVVFTPRTREGRSGAKRHPVPTNDISSSTSGLKEICRE